MDKTIRSLRISIIIQWILIVAGVLIGLYEERYLPEVLRNYIIEQEKKPLSMSDTIVLVSGMFLLIGLLISSVGIYRLKSWVRSSYVACSVLGGVLFLFMGKTITPPIAGTFEYLANVAEGFIIALLFFSSARESY